MTATPFASACELAAMIRSGQISAYQLTELYLARIQQHNPALHAIVIGNDADDPTTPSADHENPYRGACPVRP
jgi:Asp-tRNA(Asn)/Glu-tRNA(Gln) amidotransferase A subunit family amidase